MTDTNWLDLDFSDPPPQSQVQLTIEEPDRYSGGFGFWEATDYAVSRRRAMATLFGWSDSWKRNKVCKECRSPFHDPSLNNQREFCSQRCNATSAMRTYRAKRAKDFGWHKCKHCRRAFRRIKGNHVFCRPKCNWDHRNESISKKLHERIDCPCGCGATVLRSRVGVRLRFASIRCRSRYYHAQRNAQLRLKNLREVKCHGCGKSFFTSFVRTWKARFHAEECYHADQSRDSGAVHSMAPSGTT